MSDNGLGHLATVDEILCLAFHIEDQRLVVLRRRHDDDAVIPMLFVQGTRDTVAELSLMTDTVDLLRPLATLEFVDGAVGEMLGTLSAWISTVVDHQEEAAAI